MQINVNYLICCRLTFLFIFWNLSAIAQCPNFNFTTQDTVCLNQELIFNVNDISDTLNYEWDFCSKDISNASSANLLVNNSNLKVVNHINHYEVNNSHYGFVASRQGKKIFRLDYGNDIDNTPTLNDLGTLGGIFSEPIEIEMYKEGDNWFGLVIDFSNSNLYRLSFGNSITNTPTAEAVALPVSLNKPIAIEIEKDGSDIIALVANFNNSNIARLNFGNSILNIPTGNNMSVSGVSSLADLVVYKDCDQWFGLVSSFSGSKVYSISFTGNLLSTPTFNQITGFTFTQAVGVEMVEDGNVKYGFVQLRAGKLIKLKYGDSWTNSPSFTDLGNYGGTISNTTWGIDFVQAGSKSRLFIAETTNRIEKISFSETCSDNKFSSGINPVQVSYNTPGKHYITLKGFDENGYFVNYTDSIFVQNLSAPSISFTTDNLCIENTNLFTASSSDDSSISTWTWDFADGGNSSVQNPIHQFDTAGQYIIELEIETFEGCSNLMRDTIKLYDAPVSDFNPPSSNLCTNSTLTFINTSIGANINEVSFSWDYNGESASSSTDGEFTFLSTGEKTITLVSELTGCRDTTSKIIDIASGPFADFSWTNNCFGDSVQFTNNSETTNTKFLWDFGDGLKDSILFEPKHLYGIAGDYQISLEVESILNGCKTAIYDTIQVNDSILTSFSFSEPTIENVPTQFFGQDLTKQEDSIISWLWDFKEFGSSSSQNPTPAFTSIDTVEVTLTVYTYQGCSDTYIDSVIVNKAICPTLNFQIDKDSVCIGEFIEISNSSVNADSYVWDYCGNDLNLLSNAELVLNNSSINTFNHINHYEVNNSHYGFVASRQGKKIFRLNYGSDIDNTPTLNDLGTLGGIFSEPIEIEMYKEGDNWFGLVIDFSNSNLYRLSFGNSITNTPTAEAVTLPVSLNKPIAIEIEKDGSDIIALVANFNNSNIARLNFGNSILNMPTGNNMSVSGVSSLADLVVYKDCDQWFGLVSSFSGSKVYSISFADNLLSAPTFNQITGFTFTQAVGVEMVEDGNIKYGFVQLRAGNLIKLKYGDSWTNSPSFTDLGNYDGTISNTTWGIDFVQAGSKSRIFIAETTNRIEKISFSENCSDNKFSSGITPVQVSYDTPGKHYITLKGFDENGYFVSFMDSIIVQDLPAPPISFTTENACVENVNIFTASSEEESSITNYNWSFGDTNTSADQNPTHQYNTAGIYNVQLSVEAENGCSNTVSKSIPIFPPPKPDFTIDAPLPCSNTQLTITNHTETFGADTLVTYAWNFNDEFISSATDTTLIFQTGGVKNITLSASIPGCTQDTVKSIEIINGPAVEFSWNGTCIGDLTEFNNLTTGENITNYLWDFGDGFTSNLQTPSHLYTDGGNYEISLLVSNEEGCENELSKPLEIGFIPSADFTYELPCSDQDIQFFDNSAVDNANIVTYNWYYNNTLLSNEEDPLLNLGAQGPKTLHLSVASNVGCKDSVAKAVEILPSPVIDIVEDIGCASEASVFTSNSSIAAGSIIANTWMIGGSIYQGNAVEYLFNNPGEHEVTLISRGSNLCEESLSETFTIFPLPTANFEYTRPCSNEQIVFTSTSFSDGDPIEDFTWTLDGQVVSFAESFGEWIEQTGSHSVRLEVSTVNNCVSAATKAVEVFVAPVSKFKAEPVLGAAPLDVTFTNQSVNATSYLWDFSENNDDQDTQKNSFYVYENLGTEVASLVALNDHECADTSRMNIQVLEAVFDLAIEGVVQSFDGDKVNFIVKIRNNGTVIATNPELKIKFNNAIEISETVDHTFYAGGTLSYPLSFSLLNMPLENVSLLCFEILAPGNAFADVSPLNNRECLNFGTEFIAVDPYPNPSKGLVTIPVILPAKQNLEVLVYNSEGAVVYQHLVSNTKSGLNVLSLDLGNIAGGNYLLSLKHSGQTKTKKLVIR